MRIRDWQHLGLSIVLACVAGQARAADAPAWPANLPRYDHIVIVVEENKDFEEIVGNTAGAPYLNQLAQNGAVMTRMFGEEHNSEGNYFWLFSGGNQNVGYNDAVPGPDNRQDYPLTGSNLGQRLIEKGLTFKGYAESLPAIGSTVALDPANCSFVTCVYARKHVPWISFGNLPNGPTADSSSNLRFEDFPSDYSRLPTVAFVIPNELNDMHNGAPKDSIPAGDCWLREHLDAYVAWAKTHNSLLVVTFDESDDVSGVVGPTFPGRLLDEPDAPIAAMPAKTLREHLLRDAQNRIATIFVGAHVKQGQFDEGNGITHVNILRTIESMYGLPRSGHQAPHAEKAGISDDAIVTDIFETQ